MKFVWQWDQDPARLDQAEAYARRALELDPLHARSHGGLGMLAFERGDTEAGVGYVERHAELAPNDPVVHLFLGHARSVQGDFLGALRELNLMMRLDPRAAVHTGRWTQLAALKYALGQSEEAVTIWERSRAVNPDDLVCRRALVAHYQAAGEPDKVRELVREILEVNPDFRAGRGMLAGRQAYPEEFARVDALLREAGLP
jgi:tetratricopeptide (TPR) repeat protein